MILILFNGRECYRFILQYEAAALFIKCQQLYFTCKVITQFCPHWLNTAHKGHTRPQIHVIMYMPVCVLARLW